MTTFATPSVTLHRTEFDTSDPARAREFIAAKYPGISLRGMAGRESGWTVRFSHADAGEFAIARLQLPDDLDFSIEYADQIVIATVLAGEATVERAGGTANYSPGDVFIANCAGAEWSCRTRQLGLLAVSLPDGLLREVMGGSEEEFSWSPAWVPRSFQPLPGRTRQWRTTTRYVEEMLASPAFGKASMLLSAAGRLLAVSALATFSDDLPGLALADDGVDAQPDALRRAIAFIDANPDIDIGINDVARAAHVTPRAVQLAFRRHLHITPMGYVRRVRLDRVHAELRDAARGDGRTVTAVAARWGFTSGSRFAQQYREAFEELPSETLRR